jgi:tRNA A37 threonylcarbamoyladenosine dehydratase
MNQYSRTELLVGAEGLARLRNARVAIFGIGGVGGYTLEALARSGVGTLDVVDDDRVCITNLNRQILATRSTVGRPKVEVARDRVAAIDPTIQVNLHPTFYLPETADQFDFTQYDYVVDAIDTVSGKLALVEQANAADVPIISCMGAGNKMDPSAFEVADIYETSVCPLARVMRRELKKRGIRKLKVVYSKEPPLTPLETEHNSCKVGCVCHPGSTRTCADRRQVPGSSAFCPAVAGLIIAGEVVKDLSGFVAPEK